MFAELDREAASRLLPIFVAPAREEAATSRMRVAANDRGTDAEAVRESRSAANQAVQENGVVFYVERSGRLWQELDEFHENLESGLQFRDVAIGSVGTIVSGFTVGYVLWALRSGLLLTSLLASLPAWTMFDPLVIVTGNGTRDEDQEESLEQLVEKQAALAAARPRQPETTEPTR